MYGLMREDTLLINALVQVNQFFSSSKAVQSLFVYTAYTAYTAFTAYNTYIA